MQSDQQQKTESNAPESDAKSAQPACMIMTGVSGAYADHPEALIFAPVPAVKDEANG